MSRRFWLQGEDALREQARVLEDACASYDELRRRAGTHVFPCLPPPGLSRYARCQWRQGYRYAATCRHLRCA